MACEEGDTATVKSGGGAAATVIDAVAECVVVEVPVTVNVVAGAVVEVVTVSVELPPAMTVAGENEPAAPAGRFETESEIDCVLPFKAAVAIVYVALLPATTDWLAGDTPSEKSGEPATPHPGNLKDAMRVLQLNVPFAGMYSVANQKVQSSTGSIDSDA